MSIAYFWECTGLKWVMHKSVQNAGSNKGKVGSYVIVGTRKLAKQEEKKRRSRN